MLWQHEADGGGEVSGQGKYTRCTVKGCRAKAQERETAKGDRFCPTHLAMWAVRQIYGMNDFSLALDIVLEMRINEALSAATNKAAT